VKALAHTLFLAALRGRQCSRDFEQRGAQVVAQSQVGQWRRYAEHEEGAHLAGGEAGQAGAVAVEKRVAAARAALAVDGHAGRAEGVDVAVDGALGDFELLGQLGRRHAPARLQKQQQRY